MTPASGSALADGDGETLGDGDALGDVDGYGEEGASTGGRLNIGIKKLLSVVEMARQEPEAVAERLTSALMGLGM